jgi:ankyrin repeat protein
MTLQGLLHTHGGDVNTRDNKNSTPLHLASVKGDCKVIRYLMKYGADLNARDEKGISRITLICQGTSLRRALDL